MALENVPPVTRGASAELLVVAVRLCFRQLVLAVRAGCATGLPERPLVLPHRASAAAHEAPERAHRAPQVRQSVAKRIVAFPARPLPGQRLELAAGAHRARARGRIALVLADSALQALFE